MSKSATESENRFFEIANILSGEDKKITIGSMMSSPGIKYKNKVIAFYHKDEMVFRVGKEADLVKLGIPKPKFLRPFKSKPPMTGWICVGFSERSKWDTISRFALSVMKSEIDK